jgi:hypothetical protein
MKNQEQVETQLERFKEELETLENNTVLKAISGIEWQIMYNVLRGQIHSLEWALGVKKVRNA